MSSTVIAKNMQVGTSGTATDNFTLYQPAAPDGTVRLANGNSGSTTDLVTVTAAGNVGIGTATLYSTKFSVRYAGATENGSAISSTSAGPSSAIYFANPNGIVGQISTNGSATSYVTSSDYRMKEDVQPMTGALAKVTALKPVTYKWKVDGSEGEGFIAHELAEVCPHAVNGEKDAIDADGNPQYQGIDVSFLVGTLTAAIQEQQAMIEQLKADVAALKAGQAPTDTP